MRLLGLDDVDIVDFKIRIPDVYHSLFPEQAWVALFKELKPKYHI
jgi:hypothetical protein